LLKTINTYIHFSFKSGDRDFDGGRSWAFGDRGICPREGDSGRRGGRKNLVFLINVPFFPIVFESKGKGIIRPITGWDMKRAEIQYYKKNIR